MAQATLDIFDATMQKTNRMIKAVEERFGWADAQKAYLALRAVMHTLRDRLTPEHAAGLAAQLPIMVRGIYFEGWKPSAVPRKMNKDEFVGEVERQINPMEYDQPTEEIIKGVVAVVQDYTDPNEVRKVKATLPSDLKNMLDDK
jgi:uncharacterized protein (DUF2267 family)